MAIKAYVLMKTTAGKTQPVVAAMRGLPGVEAADAVTGPYDVVAVVNATDVAAVGDLIESVIHTIDGVSRTMTCLSV